MMIQRKTWYILSLASLWFLNSDYTVAQTRAISSVHVSSVAPQNGDTIVVVINIDLSQVGAPDNLLGSFSASLAWDAEVIDYVSNSGPLQNFTGVVNTANSAIGSLNFNGADPNGREGMFDVLEIVFEVKGSTNSDTQLDLEYSAMAAALTFADLLAILTVNDGQVNVNDAPQNFDLLEPGNGEIIDILNPTMQWQKALDLNPGDTVLYDLGVSTSPNLSDTVLYVVELSDTAYTIPSGLQPSQQYYWQVAAVDTAGARTSSVVFTFGTSDVATGVEDGNPGVIPEKFGLFQNFPNPFNPETKINYEIPSPAIVTFRIFDIQGREVVKLLDRDIMMAGFHQVFWNGRDHAGRLSASGIYFYSIEAQPQNGRESRYFETKKMTLVK